MVIPFHPSHANPTPIDIILQKPRPQLFFTPLDATKPLSEAMKGMSFVEFPIIHIWSKRDWESAIAEKRVAAIPPAVAVPVIKRKWGAPLTILNNDPEGNTTSDLPVEQDGMEVRGEEVRLGREGAGEVKRPRLASTAGSGLLALGNYDSEDEDEGEEEGGQAEDEVEGLVMGDEHDEEVTEDDIRLMQVLGAAAAADMA